MVPTAYAPISYVPIRVPLNMVYLGLQACFGAYMSRSGPGIIEAFITKLGFWGYFGL